MVKLTGNIRKFGLEKFLTLLAFFAVFAGFGFAQTRTPTPPDVPKRVIVRPFPTAPKARIAKRIRNESEIPAEKSIAVDAKVSISLCVNDGNIKVNGWDRNEIRALVDGGSSVGFKVLKKNVQNSPVWLKVLGFDPMKNLEIGIDECLSGENIELDVPRGATIEIKGNQFDAAIESVNKASVKNNGGNITFNEIAQGVNAFTYEGDVRVENSGGVMTLNSTNGNILAFNVEPIQVNDIFTARTISGAVSLQMIKHSQVDTNSTSGIINFLGNLLSGGQYNFGTQNGSILLTVPQTSSCAVTALYGFGNFQTEIPMTNVDKTPAGQVQKLTGQIGAGDATLNLKTYSGAISIKKIQ